MQCRHSILDLLPETPTRNTNTLLIHHDLLSTVLFVLGMASPLVGIAAVNALLFTAYSNLKKIQEPYPGGPLTLGQIAIAGAGAGMGRHQQQLLYIATLHSLSYLECRLSTYL